VTRLLVFGGRTVADRLPLSRMPTAPLRGACGVLDSGALATG